MSGIIDHWGDYGKALQPWAGPGHWHDMDMLLVGTISQDHDGGSTGQRCISLDEERTQMAIWSISSAPLIMGNDMRVRGPSLSASCCSPRPAVPARLNQPGRCSQVTVQPW